MRSGSHLLIVLLGLSLVVPACGGTSDGVTPEERCAAIDEANQRCNGKPPYTPSEMMQCVENDRCYAQYYNQSYLIALHYCGSRSCNPAETDVCVKQRSDAIAASPARQRFHDACAAKSDQCAAQRGLSPGSPSDLCNVVGNEVVDSIYLQLLTCTAGACKDISQCFNGVLDAKTSACTAAPRSDQ